MSTERDNANRKFRKYRYDKDCSCGTLFANVMMNPGIVKGALCHALWLLTPTPELLKDRKVICHTVVLSDIFNAGAIYVPDPSHVVVDRDLVIGRSIADIELYVEKIMDTYRKINDSE